MEQRSIINLLLTNFNRCIQIHGPEYTNSLLKNATAGIVADTNIIEFIITRTCHIFGIQRIRLITSRDAAPLYICMALIKKETSIANKEIARLFDRHKSIPSKAIKFVSLLNPSHRADMKTYLKVKRLEEEITQHKSIK